jgi:hypothetical protein
MRKLDMKLEALGKMKRRELEQEWRIVFGEDAPPAFGNDLLARAIAYHLQEKAYGCLSATDHRQIEAAAKQLGVGGSVTRLSPNLRPGTQLARDWGGRTHHVSVMDGGFEYRQRRYRSLTAIARDITGAAWSGPRFFGLTQADSRKRGASHDAA